MYRRNRFDGISLKTVRFIRRTLCIDTVKLRACIFDVFSALLCPLFAMRHDSRGLEETAQNHAVSSAGVAGVQLLRAAFLPASYGRAAAGWGARGAAVM